MEDADLKMLELEEVKTKKKEDIKKIKKDLKSVENKKAQIKIKRDNKIKGIIVDLLIENLNEQDEMDNDDNEEFNLNDLVKGN